MTSKLKLGSSVATRKIDWYMYCGNMALTSYDVTFMKLMNLYTLFFLLAE